MCSQQSRMWGVMYAYHLPRLMEKPVSELWGNILTSSRCFPEGRSGPTRVWAGHWTRACFTCTSSHLMQNLGFRVIKCGPQLVTIVRRVVGVIFQIRRGLR